jgi:speckle-type POZ protein
MDRIKLICAQILAKSLDVESVTTTLALADRHNCSGLKDACIEFIISSNKMDDVTKTQGFANLKRSFPCVLVEVLEKAGKLRKL